MVINRLKNTLLKRIVSCPSCRNRTRIPLKLGATLAVTCPHCKTVFQVHFPTLKALFQASFFGKPLPGAVRQPLWRRILPVVFLAYMMVFSLRTCTPATAPSPGQQKIERESEAAPIITI